MAVEAIEGLQPKAAQVGVDLILEAEPIPVVLADRARITEVLENLLTNALKFTPSGGSVEIRLASTGAHVVLEVADTGVGIADADQQHLFQRFFRSARTQAAPGIGLGLSIVKAIVDAHGGHISRDEPHRRGHDVPRRDPARAARPRRGRRPGEHRERRRARRRAVPGKWARLDSNQGPRDYESPALTS